MTMTSRGLGITPPSKVLARHSRVHADPLGTGAAAVKCERPPAQAPPPPARNAGSARTGAGAAWPSGGSSRRDSGRDSRRDSGSGETCQHSPVRRCVDTYAHCTNGLRVPGLLRALRTRGTLPRGSTYCSIPAAIRVTASGVPYVPRIACCCAPSTGAAPPPARLDGQRHALLDRHAHPARADAGSREQRAAGTALASAGLLRPLVPSCAEAASGGRRRGPRGGVVICEGGVQYIVTACNRDRFVPPWPNSSSARGGCVGAVVVKLESLARREFRLFYTHLRKAHCCSVRSSTWFVFAQLCHERSSATNTYGPTPP